jgi:hypothetical protein
MWVTVTTGAICGRLRQLNDVRLANAAAQSAGGYGADAAVSVETAMTSSRGDLPVLNRCMSDRAGGLWLRDGAEAVFVIRWHRNDALSCDHSSGGDQEGAHFRLRSYCVSNLSRCAPASSEKDNFAQDNVSGNRIQS